VYPVATVSLDDEAFSIVVLPTSPIGHGLAEAVPWCTDIFQERIALLCEPSSQRTSTILQGGLNRMWTLS
jgi:hypothetical protein